MTEPLRERRIDALARAIASDIGDDFDDMPYSGQEDLREQAAVYVDAADGPLVEWLREQVHYCTGRERTFDALGNTRGALEHRAIADGYKRVLDEIERTEK